MKKRIDKTNVVNQRSLVSIVTPMYDSESYISETINTVIHQTYTNWELLLIDDGSKDNTLKVIQPFLEDFPNITLLKNDENLGAALSRNKGIKAAKGDYIAFLDADDLWKPHKLETQLAFMKKQNCAICFSSYELIDEKGNALNKEVRALKELTYSKLLRSNYIGNLTGIYSVKVLGKITLPNLRKRQDWLLWLAAIKKSGKPALGIQESLAWYRVRKGSMSSNKLNLVKHNYWVYKKGLGFSTLKSIYVMMVFLKEQFLVKSKQTIKTDKT
ncbi:glycosyltransferase family 2 protein [Tamlana sp. 2201CG12-4]|uniref:glycosyltransferase family 2 protein n=1 Tax=Tamlana sp. 2201CG12-4 TaxID=3112582 RepID=UPI002DB88199|nr:glycosyltransferase family 2 protein [Tamlana sp. 2201CG12-4]MEC3906316.1 glycosyltransferase family 2 protein [Tamlana sp. 2201CG12-4]